MMRARPATPSGMKNRQAITPERENAADIFYNFRIIACMLFTLYKAEARKAARKARGNLCPHFKKRMPTLQARYAHTLQGICLHFRTDAPTL